MSHKIKPAAVQRVTRRGLSAGTGVRRENELRERAPDAGCGRPAGQRKTARQNVSVERIWRLIRSRKAVVEETMSEARIRKLRRMARNGALETERAIERSVDGILGHRARCKDPGLSRHRP